MRQSIGRKQIHALLLVVAVVTRTCVGRGHGLGIRLVEQPFGVSSRSTSQRQRYISSSSSSSSSSSHVSTSGRRAFSDKKRNSQNRNADQQTVLQCSRRTSASKAAVAIPASAVITSLRPLLFWENMVCGAISRSIAQTVMHPANTMKTILQSSRGADSPTLTSLLSPKMFRTLTRGAGANFLLSVPHGAVNFAVLEFVRNKLNAAIINVPMLSERADTIGPGLDFLSSAISTICCSIVSTPQMMITDNIMAGNYPNLVLATKGLYEKRGIMGFYSGWWPGLVGKIPSYALTWTFFQQLKQFRDEHSDHPAKNYENTIMGCIASGAAVCIMMPLDTIKTRLVTQGSSAIASSNAYKGIIDCAIRVAQEEGIKTFYRGIAPRLFSVMPMMGIQFGVYEAMKRVMIRRNNLDKENEDKMVIAQGMKTTRKSS